MTISSQVRKAGPYVGSDSATVFPFAFKVFAASDLYVVRTNSSLGVDSVLALGSGYTVSLNADQNANPGGTVTLPAVLATGFNLTITSSLQYLQPTDLTNQGGFYPAVITNALDRLTIFCQQLYDQVGRSLKISVSTPAGVSTTLPPPLASRLIGWNESGDALQNFDPTTLATVVAFGTANVDTFTGDGAWTQKALSANPGALNNLAVSIGGAVQEPGADFTWTGGTTITFTSAPPLGARVIVRYMQGLPQGNVGDASVTTAKIVDDAVTEQKINWAGSIGESRVVVTSADFGAVGGGTGNQAAAIQAAIAAAQAIAATKGGCDVIFPAGNYRITAGLRVSLGKVNLIFQGGAQLTPVGNFDTVQVESLTAATWLYKNVIDRMVCDETGKTGGRTLVSRYIAESVFDVHSAAGYDGLLIETFNTVDLNARLTDYRAASAIYALIRGGVGALARSDVLRIGRMVMGGTYVAGQQGLVLDGFVHTVRGQSVYAVNIGGKGFWARNTVGAADNPTFLNFDDYQADYCLEALRLDTGQVAEFDSAIVNGSRSSSNIYVGAGWTDARFVGGRSTGAAQAGIALAGADAVVQGMSFKFNSSNVAPVGGTLNTYPGILVGGTSTGTRVLGCRSGDAATSTYQSYGLQIDTGAAGFIVKDNDLRNNVGSGVNNGAGTSATKIVADNIA
jgi:Pectate lyase superfamily protein